MPAAEFALQLEDELPSQGLAVITSASAQEPAQKSARWGGSVFTSSFISALSGAADASGDGEITLRWRSYARCAPPGQRVLFAMRIDSAVRFVLDGLQVMISERAFAVAEIALHAG